MIDGDKQDKSRLQTGSVVLLWISYSCLILFFGEQFTYVYANRYGQGVKFTSNAVKFTQKVGLEREKQKAEEVEGEKR